MSNIYWESQKKDLCRMHSLNFYFGYHKLSEKEFHQYCLDYNDYIKSFYGEIVLSQNYDIFPIHSLISYVIDKIDNKYCYYVPLGRLSQESMSLEKLINETKSFFVFSHSHVFVVKYQEKDGRWYKVDSLSGIVPISLRTLSHKFGYIFPRDNIHLDFDKAIILSKISTYLAKNNLGTTTQVKEWIDNHFKDKLLDDLEIYLANLNQITIKQNLKNKNLNKLIVFFYQNKLNINNVLKRLVKILVNYDLINLTKSQTHKRQIIANKKMHKKKKKKTKKSSGKQKL